MRYIWAFILIFSAINPAKADCWAISNNDVQKMCLAKTKMTQPTAGKLKIMTSKNIVWQ